MNIIKKISEKIAIYKKPTPLEQEKKVWEKDFNELEVKWQKKWEESNLFFSKVDKTKEKFYCLVMFPYPSGRIHMGHIRNYVIGDVIAQYNRMLGKNVLHPIGWDAFGLPAENAAIKNNVHPEKWTKDNIDSMRSQLKRVGISYDWSKEIATCDPSYYRWNQWFFVKMFERNLVYKKEAPVNWCPKCETVLANEQVQQGICWRCGSDILQKKLSQWFVKLTDYAQRLLDDLDLIKDGWPQEVITMQRNWIGRSEGTEIVFKVVDKNYNLLVYTTRADTLFGATFVTLSPEHELSLIAAKKNPEVQDYLGKVSLKGLHERKDSKEKSGIFSGLYAINPINSQKIPIYIGEYVLMEYGTGAIMCVPAHDQRDFEFAKKNHLSIVEVIKPVSGKTTLPDAAFEDDGVLINSDIFNGLTSQQARQKITEVLFRRGLGAKKVNFRIKDWLVSRQRYWGTPIPIIYCDRCGVLPVLEKDLPVLLPKDVSITGKGESPLNSVEKFVNTKCYNCGSKAKRETDTMDTFVDSSWYYARYIDSKNEVLPFSKDIANYWLDVDQYIGGIEHACMHLIYSRFWHKFMYDIGLVNSKEPFVKLLTQGMVTLNGSAMSKSKGNIVEPDVIINKYGADTTRLFILFAAPPQKQLDWNDKSVEGCWRFINRVDRLVDIVLNSDTVAFKEDYIQQKKDLVRSYNRILKSITEDIEQNYQLNTAIAKIMELTNILYQYPYLSDAASREIIKNLVIILSPFTPHLCEELWCKLGGSFSVRMQPWPKYDKEEIKEEIVEIPIQINGKLRSKITVGVDISQDELEKVVLSDEKIKTFLEGKEVYKWIIIPNKLVNLVIKEKTE